MNPPWLFLVVMEEWVSETRLSGAEIGLGKSNKAFLFISSNLKIELHILLFVLRLCIYIKQQLQQWKFSFIFIYFSTIWIKLSKGSKPYENLDQSFSCKKSKKKDYQQCIHSTVNSRKVMLRRAKYHTSKKIKKIERRK